MVRSLRAGDPAQVGAYRLTGFIGEGGQGAVYAGLSPSGEQVAIKLLHARLADDWQAVARFQREAESTRRVAEFCTARVLDVGAADGRPYLVSEYVEGPSLQHQVGAGGPLRGDQLVRLAIATATALVAIHRAGVVHRDFKPSNVLLAHGGPRVIDFGIARALDVSMSLTTSVVGTPAYMAPEQFNGTPEQASDLFAWAGTMVFAATGRPAFGNGPLPAVIHRILTFGPDLSGVPEQLGPLVFAALNKDPRMRPTAEQLLQGLLTLPAPSPVGPSDPAGPSGPAGPGPSGFAGPSGPAGASAHPGAPGPSGGPGPLGGSSPAWHSGPVGTPVPGGASAHLGGHGPSGGPGPLGGPSPVGGPGHLGGPGPVGGAGQLGGPGYPGGPEYPGGAGYPGGPGYPGGAGYPGGYPGSGPVTPTTRPSTRRRRGLLVSAGAGVMAVVVGLGVWLWPRHDTATQGGGDPQKVTTGSPDAALTGVVNPSDRKGGTLKMATSSELDSPDPGDTYLNDVWNVARLYSRSLMLVKPARSGTQVVPDLAESAGKASDGGKTWTYRLRQGLKFSDGTPITAADVKHAVARTLDRKVLERGPALFSTLLGTKGADAITVPDDFTIIFNLAKPMATFDYAAALLQTAPVPEKADTGAKYREKVLSSGPYMITSVAADRLTLGRNPQWVQSTDPNRTALPDAYEITFGQQSEQIAAQLLAGQIDVGPYLAPPAYARVSAQPALRARTDIMTTGVLRYLSVNPQVPPLDKIECRKAVLQALDHTSLSMAFGGATSAQQATSLLPPDEPGYQPLDPYKDDLSAARGWLKECGHPDGFPLTMVYRETAKDTPAAEAVQAALAKAGIKVTLKGVEITKFYRDYGKASTLTKEKVGLVSRLWGADLPEPGSFLAPLVDSRLIQPGEDSSNQNVRIPEVDQLIDKADAELDPTRRAALWSEVDQRVMKEALLLPTVWDRAPLLRGDRLTNVQVNRALQNYDLLTLGLSR
ncbi:ABC transporter substrate-binding protein [Nonomuraea sp. NPDC050556]|uniref:ABC transporter substrate-binding protein n=1 Tax=Nonomuraea sp. NPDC050556 TaxID=3364369 RepID=UPI00379DF48F